MKQNEQQLLEAAMHYRILIDQANFVALSEFVEAYPSELREELIVYIEEIMALGYPDESLILTAEETHMIDQSLAKARTKTVITPKTLTDLRKILGQSVGKLATHLNIPVPVLAQLERGAINVASIPHIFIEALANALNQSVVVIQAALQVTPPAQSVQYSANDGIKVEQETLQTFAEALRLNGVSSEQSARWEEQ